VLNALDPSRAQAPNCAQTFPCMAVQQYGRDGERCGRDGRAAFVEISRWKLRCATGVLSIERIRRQGRCRRMALSVLNARETDAGVEVTLVTEDGLHTLTGAPREIATLAGAMRNASAIASAGWPCEPVADVVVGADTVRFHFREHGEVVLQILRG
jgi:hypothetical protein